MRGRLKCPGEFNSPVQVKCVKKSASNSFLKGEKNRQEAREGDGEQDTQPLILSTFFTNKLFIERRRVETNPEPLDIHQDSFGLQIRPREAGPTQGPPPGISTNGIIPETQTHGFTFQHSFGEIIIRAINTYIF